MDQKEIERLKYRRQYILAPQKIVCPFEHKVIKVSAGYYLYSHLDLGVTELNQDEAKILLLGDLFDYQNPNKNNLSILKDLFDPDFNKILEKSAKYNGRFVIIYSRSNSLVLFHDAMAARKAFYSYRNEQVWIASQSHLLAKILNICPTQDKSKLAYYKSSDYAGRFSSNICDTTYYDTVFQLMPNHYLDINLLKTIRYWPNRTFEVIPLEDTVKKCAEMIKGFMEAIALRYEVMLPITAGKDSRMLLAASYNIRNKIYYYTNKEAKFKKRSADLRIPRKLLRSLNLNFHVVDPYIPVDKDFEQVYFENNPFGSKFFLPLIYNYYINFDKKVNLPGNSVTGGFEYYLLCLCKNVSLKNLVELEELTNHEFVRNLYNKWLESSNDVCLRYDIPLLCLFYWENRLTNILLQVQLDKDIAQEDFNPFNSRQLISTFLAVDKKEILPPRNLIYKKIMHYLWPEVLKEPINPSARTTILKFLDRIGFLTLSYRIKNRFVQLRNDVLSYL